MPDIRSTIHALSALALTASVGLAQSVIEWASPVDGDFGVATNWFPAVVPGEFDTAVLGGVGAYTVFATDGTIAALDLANPDAVLQVIDQSSRNLLSGDVRGLGVLRLSTGVPGEGCRVIVSGMLDAKVELFGAFSVYAVLVGESAQFGPLADVSGVGQVQGMWTGPGTLRIEQPGLLDLDGTYRSATVKSSGGGRLNIAGAGLYGCTIRSTPDSQYISNDFTIVQNSVFTGEYRIHPGDSIRLGGGNTFEDGLHVDGGRANVWGGQVLDTTVRLDDGRLHVESSLSAAALGPAATVSGTGQIFGSWTSEGTIAIDEPGTLGFRGACTGGTFRASNGGMLGFESATLTGVTIHIADGGSIMSDSSVSLTDTTIEGELVVRPGDSIAFGDGVRADAGVRVNDGSATGVSALRLLEDASLQTRVHLDGRTPGLARLSPAVRRARIGGEGVVTGNGRFEGILFVDGTLAPGIDGGAAGDLQLFSDTVVRLEPTARVLIDIAGPTAAQFDRIRSIGLGTQFRMNGTLRVRFADGYTPEPADIYEIIRVETLERAFATIDIEGAPGGSDVGPAHVVYAGSSVLVVVCAADRDGDGELTMFDFIEFRNQFDAGDLRADLDQDGALTIFDFLVFQNRFDAGCG